MLLVELLQVTAVYGKASALVTHQTIPIHLSLSGNHEFFGFEFPCAALTLGHSWLKAITLSRFTSRSGRGV